MSGFQIKFLAVLFEAMFWVGIVGLSYEAFRGQFSFSVICLWAMILCLRWQAGCNTASIKTIIRALDRLDFKSFLSKTRRHPDE